MVAALNVGRANSAIGYEPFMDLADRGSSSTITGEWGQVVTEAPFSLVTVLEVVEHLYADELSEALARFGTVLSPNGCALLSMPIEIGPALVLKEISGSMQFGPSEYTPTEFIGASVFGRSGRRARDIKSSHKGFDFRRSITAIRNLGWRVDVVCYAPLPLGTWYGNSQVFVTAIPAAKPERVCAA